jgi:hypothetical protein
VDAKQRVEGCDGVATRKTPVNEMWHGWGIKVGSSGAARG